MLFSVPTSWVFAERWGFPSDETPRVHHSSRRHGGAGGLPACGARTAAGASSDRVPQRLNSSCLRGQRGRVSQGLERNGIRRGTQCHVEYHWMQGKYERVPELVEDFVRRGVALIASPGFAPGALAAKSCDHDDRPERSLTNCWSFWRGAHNISGNRQFAVPSYSASAARQSWCLGCHRVRRPGLRARARLPVLVT